MTPPRHRPLVAAALGLYALRVHAGSLPELLDQVPPPPADYATALSWTANGAIVEPGYLQLKQALEAERAAIAALNGGAMPATPGAPAPGTSEPVEVQLALKAYADYLDDYSDRKAPLAAVGKRARWLHAAMADKGKAVLSRMRPCPLPCNDPAALAQNQPLLAERRAFAEQDLRQWNTLFSDWRAKRSGIVTQAQAQIAATGEGAKANSAAARSGIAQYRAAMLREIEALLSVTELALKRVVWIESGDVDAVSASTYSPKPKKS